MCSQLARGPGVPRSQPIPWHRVPRSVPALWGAAGRHRALLWVPGWVLSPHTSLKDLVFLYLANTVGSVLSMGSVGSMAGPSLLIAEYHYLTQLLQKCSSALLSMGRNFTPADFSQGLRFLRSPPQIHQAITSARPRDGCGHRSCSKWPVNLCPGLCVPQLQQGKV